MSVSFFVSNLQTANWASKLFFFFRFTNLDVESVATAPVYVKTAVLLGISFFLFLIINPPLTGILKVYFIISLIKRNNIGFYAGGEGSSFPLSRQRLVFGFIPRKSKGSDGSMWYFFLGTIQTFFLCNNGLESRKKEHKGNFKYFSIMEHFCG